MKGATSAEGASSSSLEKKMIFSPGDSTIVPIHAVQEEDDDETMPWKDSVRCLFQPNHKAVIVFPRSNPRGYAGTPRTVLLCETPRVAAVVDCWKSSRLCWVPVRIEVDNVSPSARPWGRYDADLDKLVLGFDTEADFSDPRDKHGSPRCDRPLPRPAEARSYNRLDSIKLFASYSSDRILEEIHVSQSLATLSHLF